MESGPELGTPSGCSDGNTRAGSSLLELARFDSIEEGPETEAAARSMMYRHLASAFCFPSPESHRNALERNLLVDIERCLEALPYSCGDMEPLLAALTLAEPDYEEFQSHYIELFDIGAGGPPCPLYGGAWVGERKKVMEEALRFYRFFGLSVTVGEEAIPDYLTTELEFLHYLAFRELQAIREGNDVDSFRRAERDFLNRHPARWLPQAQVQLNSMDAPPPYWAALVGLACTFCSSDANHLIDTQGPG